MEYFLTVHSADNVSGSSKMSQACAIIHTQIATVILLIFFRTHYKCMNIIMLA